MSNNASKRERTAAKPTVSVGKGTSRALAATTTATGTLSDPETPTDEKTEGLIVSPSPALSQAKRLMQASLTKGRKGGKITVVPVNLVIAFTATSGAAATQNPVVAIQPGSATEFASMAALFDEFICDGGVAHIRAFLSAVGNTAGVDWAVAYDPSNVATYGSVNTVMEADQHHGPVALSGGTGATGLISQPIAVTPTGFQIFRFRAPKGPYVHDPNVASVITTGEWSSTAVTTSTYGNLKFFVEAPSAGTSSINGHIVMRCRFRMRS